MKTGLIGLALLVWSTGWAAPLATADPTPPNIILMLADDLGYSDLGCFGGEIDTPNLDSLAQGGLRMTQLYNTARCCSTRASLLTGLYPHRAGVGAMTADLGLPGYRGFLNDQSVTIATRLLDAGYRTYLSGKWHLRGAGNPECTPLNRGFDEFFGHYKAYASFWREDIFYRLPEGRKRVAADVEDFYATNAITDHAINFIGEARRADEPYFLYLSYNAPHFPLHAPKEVVDKYADTYAAGWDAIRERRYARMRELGILRESFELSPRGHVTKVPNRNLDSPYYDQQIPAWNDLPADRRADLARRMAIYAAMVEIMDRNIGRVVADLKTNGEFDETLIVFLSDNGACAEWDPFGFDNEPYPKNRLHIGGEELAEMGSKGTFHSYGTGWANACNTPFRLYKHYNHEGGISTPTIIHWPAKIPRTGEIDRQPAHLVDLTATLAEVGGASYPSERNGQAIHAPAGVSLSPIFAGEKMAERPLFFEHEGNRAIRLGKWKLVWTNFQRRWELYDINKDRSEMNDLVADHPDKVAELEKLWLTWAGENAVALEKVEAPATGMPKLYYVP
jgi:arylsulfatase